MPINLNLGCGPDLRVDCVNIDLQEREGVMVHDLRKGLPPFKNIDFIYSSHFFEHLTNDEGFNLLKDCYERMKEGGIIRLVLPDFRSTFKAYIEKDEDYFNLIDMRALGFPDDRLCWINRLEYSVYQFGEHISLWDDEKAKLLLSVVGFKTVESKNWDSNIDGDNLLRKKYSFIVQGTK